MLLILLLGAVVGLFAGAGWSLWAPSVPTLVTEQGQATMPGDSTLYFDSVAYFFVVSVIAGVVLGIAVWRMSAQRGPRAVVMLTASAGLGAWIAAQFGTFLVGFRAENAIVDDDIAIISLAPEMSLWNVLIVLPMVAVFVYFVAAGVSADPDLGVRRNAGASDERGSSDAAPNPLADEVPRIRL
ncbi:DUF2567 domain-containing protein [Hoyosella rhizosphaerae]|uniref:DUF2567 domain-containing protein n=1 Tax=Hoyosella rhizosphaerae TaxID=1755582 RepID=A0A916UFV6_9ACTN|nr:DUF2567 domain-containing protein [Hoyosella rhizosphaerae]MBN4925589.1 DUF2567 domain-containing protein [Hoyosella rhizosphaerae]GGC69464.1 hypothetical protein GCM10011410_22850 [Hoyosella rhizosphaerae]